jgi:hypothetical protein
VIQLLLWTQSVHKVCRLVKPRLSEEMYMRLATVPDSGNMIACNTRLPKLLPLVPG